jgi:hypothetical protein
VGPLGAVALTSPRPRHLVLSGRPRPWWLRLWWLRLWLLGLCWLRLGGQVGPGRRIARWVAVGPAVLSGRGPLRARGGDRLVLGALPGQLSPVLAAVLTALGRDPRPAERGVSPGRVVLPVLYQVRHQRGADHENHHYQYHDDDRPGLRRRRRRLHRFVHTGPPSGTVPRYLPFSPTGNTSPGFHDDRACRGGNRAGSARACDWRGGECSVNRAGRPRLQRLKAERR